MPIRAALADLAQLICCLSRDFSLARASGGSGAFRILLTSAAQYCIIPDVNFVIPVGIISSKTGKRRNANRQYQAFNQISPHTSARGRLLVQLALGRSCVGRILV